MPFLTLEDPRAQIKGSRDPLGTVPIWSHFGRKLVTNLTVAANSVRGFSIALLGRYFGERLVQEDRIPAAGALPLFLCMEEIGAYVRRVGSEVQDDIRGIERVNARIAENPRSATIAEGPKGWILSNPKVYGLWGLFTVSGRASGLFSEGPVGITAEARAFVEDAYLPSLRTHIDALERLLVRGGQLSLSRKDGLFRALLKALPDPIRTEEAPFYAETLRDALRTPSILPYVVPERQQRLRRLLERHADLEKGVSRTEFATLERAATKVDEGLSLALYQVQVLEGFFVLATSFFDHLLTCHEQTPRQVATSMEDHWGLELPNLDPTALKTLRDELESTSGPEITAAFLRTAAALAIPDYEEALRQLVQWNTLVMRGRGGAGWLRLKYGKLDVQYRGAETRLPSGDALPDLWHNSYFVSSLKSITRQIAMAR